MNKPQASSQSKRLLSIDFLRGIAASMVAFGHIFSAGPVEGATESWYGAIKPFVVSLGDWGVPLFFVISGFCIHMTMARYRMNAPKGFFGDFWKRRIRRLYPPYLVMLLFSMGIVAFVTFVLQKDRYLPFYEPPVALSMLTDFILHSLMLHGLFPRYDGLGGNGAYWTLAREEYLYLLYFVVLFFRKKTSLLKTLGLVTAVGAITVLVVGAEQSSRNTFVLWFQWVLGCLAVEYYLGLSKLPRWSTHPLCFLAFLYLSVLNQSNPLKIHALGMAFFVLLNWVVKLEANHRWPQNFFTKAFQKIGIFSYSLYLLHMPFAEIFLKLYKPLFGTPKSGFMHLVWTSTVFLSILIVSKVFFILVESRFLSHSREQKNTQTPSAMPVLAT